MKINTIHIHTNNTFIHNSDRFKGNLFENTVIIISKKRSNHISQEQIIQIKNSQKAILEVIKICKKAKLVILYDLDLVKINIAMSLPKNIKIVWRFFGHELYNRHRHLYLSTNTKKTLGIKNFLWRLKFFNDSKWSNKFFSFLSQKLNSYPLFLFDDVLKRIDYFLGLSKLEYEFLLRYWPDLPQFIQHPIILPETKPYTYKFDQKNDLAPNLIIIGNSKGIYNNHIDIINLIERNSNKDQYNFTFLFNYGLEKNYTKKIRRLIKGKRYFNLIEEFMSLDEFDALYEKANALVINSYRQMAMGNIFTALKKGVKVYLNEKNLMLQWFKEEGFKIYNLKNFNQDLKNNDLLLTPEDALHNFDQLKKLSEKYSVEKFQKELYELCAPENK